MPASRSLLRAGATLALVAASLVAPMAPGGAAHAQRPDSARVAPLPAAPALVAPDTLRAARLTPPLSPKRAFLYSLVAPGYAQSVLGRSSATGIFVLAEAVAAVMLLESSAGLREARRLARDTVFLGSDPVTGAPVRRVGAVPRSLIRSRQAQVEDWIAVLVANHLFAAADAFVAAHLWDVPARIAPRSEYRPVTIGTSLRW